MILSGLNEKKFSIVPYFATIYYAEIIYLMLVINFFYGKVISIITCMLLAFLLTVHVIRLFNKKNFNRLLQLYIMDVHAAYSLAFFFNKIYSGYNLAAGDYVVIFFRLAAAAAEIIMILVLTDKLIKNEYPR
jgi:hypothetical protein